VVCFEQPGAGVLIMTNSSNGESMFVDVLEGVLNDTFTPVAWLHVVPLSRGRAARAA
jgi:hypothetical protein